MPMPLANVMNLNRVEVRTDFEPSPSPSRAPVEDEGIIVYLRDLEEHLIHHIEDASVVLGCVAWLTSPGILAALANVPNGINIVVQKEDFLRPDMGAASTWKASLLAQYARLRPALSREMTQTILDGMSVCSDPTIDAVRCMGNHNADKLPAFPRMHHKFLLFCHQTFETWPAERWDEASDDWIAADEILVIPRPYAVWTGSFNFTHNASNSFENALYTTRPAIVQAYHQEWAWIEALSEPLNWDAPWVTPEWRLGT